MRERVKPLGVLRALSGRGVLSKIRAVIAGWRVRRILQTKEIATIVQQIKDYQQAYFDVRTEDNQRMQRSLLLSRTTCVQRLIDLIARMQERGSWLRYAKCEVTQVVSKKPRQVT